MGLVKTRRLAAMQKQQRAILLRQGFHLRGGSGGQDGGLKFGTPPPVKKGGGACQGWKGRSGKGRGGK